MEKNSKKEHNFDIHSLKNGMLSGFASVFITQPFQVIRSNMMIKYFKNMPAGFIYTIKETYFTEGIRGFYRSINPTLLRVPLNNALYFSCLEFFKKITSKSNYLNTNVINMISSALSRGLCCITLNPLLIIITRFEIIGFKDYKSTMHGISKIYMEEGMLGYFKGLKVLLIKEVPSGAIFYFLYEIVKKFIKSLGYGIQIQSSVSAFSVNTFITMINNPLDVIRTRLQYLHYSKNEKHDYQGIISGLRDITRNEGLRGLFIGMIPRLIKRAVGSTIAWTVYETLKERDERLLKNKKNSVNINLKY